MRIPSEIRRLENKGINIRWSDGQETFLESRLLRESCPCATCRERRGDGSHAKPLSPKKPSSLAIVEASADEELRLEQIWMVGKYAVGIRWGDGHDTGIYTFDYLSALPERVNEEPTRL